MPARCWQTPPQTAERARESWASEMRPGRGRTGADSRNSQGVMGICCNCRGCTQRMPGHPETRCQCLGMCARVRTHRFSHMHMHRGQDTAQRHPGAAMSHLCCLPRHQEDHSCCHLPSRTPGMVARHHHMSHCCHHLPRCQKQSQTTHRCSPGIPGGSRAASMPTVCSGGVPETTPATRNSRSRPANASAHPHQGT